MTLKKVRKAAGAIILGASVFAVATTGSHRKAHAFALEVDMSWWMYVNIIGAFLNCGLGRTCEDPLSYGEADGKGLHGDALLWDVNVPYRLSESLTVGVTAGIGDFDTKWGRFAQKTDADVTLGGAFAIWRPMPDTRITANVHYIHMDTDFSILGSTGSYDTDTWRFALDGAKTFDMGTFYVEPGLGISYATADRESFVDTLFAVTTPSADLEQLQLSTSLTVGVPIAFGHQCSATAKHCRQAEVFGRIKLSYNEGSGFSKDPTFPPSALLDDDFVGIEAGVGAMVPVSDFVLLGGNARIFDAGDMDGYMLQAVLNIDIQGLIERDR